ncbi:hypothetical protein HYY73_02335 [Candidatus Woesearchaeota archaeon]|nr:hypothetical protein [Candidatus Woesearchaeota archaeon]
MIIRFTASNVVAMILFIPLLIAIGLVLAFIVPLLALIIAAASILFLGLYALAKIGLIKKQQVRIGGTSGSSGGHSSESHKKGESTLEVKDYRVR